MPAEALKDFVDDPDLVELLGCARRVEMGQLDKEVDIKTETYDFSIGNHGVVNALGSE